MRHILAGALLLISSILAHAADPSKTTVHWDRNAELDRPLVFTNPLGGEPVRISEFRRRPAPARFVRGLIGIEESRSNHTGRSIDDPIIGAAMDDRLVSQCSRGLIQKAVMHQAIFNPPAGQAEHDLAVFTEPVSVARLLGSLLSDAGIERPTRGTRPSTRFRIEILEEAQRIDLPGLLENVGMPGEGAAVKQLLDEVPYSTQVLRDRPESFTPPARPIGEPCAHWPCKQENTEAELQELGGATTYMRFSDGPQHGRGPSWAVTWCVPFEKLPKAAKTATLDRVFGDTDTRTENLAELPKLTADGRQDPLDPDFLAGVYCQALMGDPYLVEAAILMVREHPIQSAEPGVRGGVYGTLLDGTQLAQLVGDGKRRIEAMVLGFLARANRQPGDCDH